MTTAAGFLSPDTKGHSRLWQVFWIQGVALSHVLFAAILCAYSRIPTIGLALALAGFVAYTAWILRKVWINADNVDNPLHGQMARYLSVAWALNAVLVSLLLLLGHAGQRGLPLIG